MGQILDRLLARASTQAMREGLRLLRAGSVLSLTTEDGGRRAVVRGFTGQYEVLVRGEGTKLVLECTCPSWRKPCKHLVAAALTWKERLGAEETAPARPEDATEPPPKWVHAPDAIELERARAKAIEERRQTADREEMIIEPAEPPSSKP